MSYVHTLCEGFEQTRTWIGAFARSTSQIEQSRTFAMSAVHGLLKTLKHFRSHLAAPLIFPARVPGRVTRHRPSSIASLAAARVTAARVTRSGPNHSPRLESLAGFQSFRLTVALVTPLSQPSPRLEVTLIWRWSREPPCQG